MYAAESSKVYYMYVAEYKLSSLLPYWPTDLDRVCMKNVHEFNAEINILGVKN